MIEWAPLAVKELGGGVGTRRGPTAAPDERHQGASRSARASSNPGPLRGRHLRRLAHPPVTEAKPGQPLTLHGLNGRRSGPLRATGGLCLAYCPTFSELGTEMDSPARPDLADQVASPRGRIKPDRFHRRPTWISAWGCRALARRSARPAWPYGPAHRGRARPRSSGRRPGGFPASRVSGGSTSHCCCRTPRSLRPGRRPGFASYQASGLRRLVSGLRAAAVPAPSRCATGSPCCRTCRPAADRAPPLAEVTAGHRRPARPGGACSPGASSKWPSAPRTRRPARVLARNGVEVIAPRTQACLRARSTPHAGEHDNPRSRPGPGAPSRPSRAAGVEPRHREHLRLPAART